MENQNVSNKVTPCLNFCEKLQPISILEVFNLYTSIDIELYEIQRVIELNRLIGTDRPKLAFVEKDLLKVAYDLTQLWLPTIRHLNDEISERCIVTIDDGMEHRVNSDRCNHYIDCFLNTGSYNALEQLVSLCGDLCCEQEINGFDCNSMVSEISHSFDYYLDGLITHICNGFDFNSFFCVIVKKDKGQSCCFVHKYQQVPKIVISCSDEGNPFVLAHEMGHCIHFYLSMLKQHFYAFEASIYVRESLAFMFEALTLVFFCNRSNASDKKAHIEQYKKNSSYYLGENSGVTDSYRKYYPLARIVGEALAVRIITGKITSEKIVEWLCSGGHLKIEELVKLSRV